MLKLVKWNDTLIKSDTLLAFVAIIYVSFFLPLSLSLTGYQPIN